MNWNDTWYVFETIILLASGVIFLVLASEYFASLSETTIVFYQYFSWGFAIYLVLFGTRRVFRVLMWVREAISEKELEEKTDG